MLAGRELGPVYVSREGATGGSQVLYMLAGRELGPI